MTEIKKHHKASENWIFIYLASAVGIFNPSELCCFEAGLFLSMSSPLVPREKQYSLLGVRLPKYGRNKEQAGCLKHLIFLSITYNLRETIHIVIYQLSWLKQLSNKVSNFFSKSKDSILAISNI